jgi:hypothetical protein
MKVKNLTESFNMAELGGDITVPLSQADSAETTRKRVESKTEKKFKGKTFKYKVYTRTK